MKPSVTCRSGHTYADRPTAFTWQGRSWQVARVLKRWRSPQGPGFQVLTAGGERFTLTYHEGRDEWTVTPDAGR